MVTVSLSIVIIAGGDMEKEISPAVLEWFQSRGISEKTLKDTGVYSEKHHTNGSDVIVFPFLRKGEEVNAKYRSRGKKFYQKTGGEKIFFNADILENENIKNGSQSLIITEGELDCLSVLECGHPYVVSVPDGAPCKVSQEEIDPEHDTKYGYIFNHWQQLQPIRHIIIATDGDSPGRALAEELIRRLGRVRCQFIEYPNDCKDLNEVLTKHGVAEVLGILKDAQPYPVSGIYTYSQLPPEPELEPLSTGWGRLDTYLRPFFPAFMVVTGTAGSGKSTWVNQLVAQMSILHKFSVGIASFEMRIKPFVSETLLQTYIEMGMNIPNKDEWLEDNFVFIAPEPGGEPTDNKLGGYGTNPHGNFDIDWLLDKAAAAVIRHGIRILVIDPWNEIEHAMRVRENTTEYVGRTIRAFKRFGREFNVLVILVAHPSKGGAEKAKVKSWRKNSYGEKEEVISNEITLYDISDSAHFANKADFGVVLSRIGEEGSGNFDSWIMVKKVRYQTLTGQIGKISLTYDPIKRTFGQ
jgi:twinkle protein